MDSWYTTKEIILQSTQRTDYIVTNEMAQHNVEVVKMCAAFAGKTKEFIRWYFLALIVRIIFLCNWYLIGLGMR
jgi:hypothetical protein